MSNSDETRIALLELTSKTLMDKLEEFQADNKEEHQDIVKSLEGFHNKTNASIKEIQDKLDKALEQKAGIWVEKAFSWLLYTVGGFIVSAIMYTIIKYKL